MAPTTSFAYPRPLCDIQLELISESVLAVSVSYVDAEYSYKSLEIYYE